MSQKRIGIVTVHGTGDTAEGPDGDKWFQNGSEFVARLKARLAAHGLDATIIPFLWSGANSARAREQAARNLVHTLRKQARRHGPLHVIGHSHGGNVANEAARMLPWRPKFDMLSFLLNPMRPLFRGKEKIASVTTVGTPFFRSQLSNAESFGGAAFLFLLIISTLVLAIGGLFLAAMLIQTHRSPDQVLEDVRRIYALQSADAAAAALGGSDASGQASPSIGDAPVTEEQIRAYAANEIRDNTALHRPLYLASTIYLAFVGPLFFIYPIAVSGLARIIRLRRKQNMRAKVHSIWHPHDEAIAFLQRVERMPLEPFPRGALWRTSRTAGIVWGVRIINMLVLAGLILWIAGMAGVDFPAQFKTGAASILTDAIAANSGSPTAAAGGGDNAIPPQVIHPTFVGGTLILLGVVGMPLIFGVIYVVTRLLVFGLGLELGLRHSLNGAVGGVLKGIAFGRDGDERVGEVATQSHCHGSQCTILEGEVADRMQQGAGAAADKLIEKYRWALFSVGGNDNTALEALATDAMTWNSLIHTTYFDQPEVADVIADYIHAQMRDPEQDARAPNMAHAAAASPAPLPSSSPAHQAGA